MRHFAALAGMFALLACRPAAAACGACNAGDATVTAVGVGGAGSGVVGGVSTLATRNLAGTSQTGLHDQVSEQVTALALWSVSPSIRLQASLPWVERDLKVAGQHWSNSGLGDVNASATFVLWKTPGMSFGQAVAVVVGGTIPTGTRVANSSEHAQPGQGAWSGLVGASWGAHYELWSLYVSQAYKANTANENGYRYGDIWTGNAGVQHQLWTDVVDGTFEINARYAGTDHDRDGFLIDDTGGTVVYATPGLLAQLGGFGSHRFFLRGSVQLPFVNIEFGHQVPGIVWQLGVNAAF